MRLRSGAISSRFLGQSFLGWWTSSLAATHASHSVQPASDSEQTTQDIFGPTSQAAFDFFDQSSVSSRTSKDTLALDSEKSLENWKNLVTKRRGEYSQRLNAARLTSESECLSWPTATTRDWKDTGDMSQSMIRKDGKKRMDTLGRVVQANHSTHGSRPELLSDAWPTPTALSRVRDEETIAKCLKFRQSNGKTTVPLYLEERVNIEEKSRPESWATPQARDNRSGGAERWNDPNRSRNLNDQIATATQNAKLNPRWVETLMGLPVGWTMPSCASPVTIGLTSCASLATESSQLQQL